MDAWSFQDTISSIRHWFVHVTLDCAENICYYCYANLQSVGRCVYGWLNKTVIKVQTFTFKQRYQDFLPEDWRKTHDKRIPGHRVWSNLCGKPSQSLIRSHWLAWWGHLCCPEGWPWRQTCWGAVKKPNNWEWDLTKILTVYIGLYNKL